MITLFVNGRKHEVDVTPDTPLLWAVRDELNMTGSKFGYGVAQCGCCTMLVDGEATRTCVLPVSAAVGKHVETIESSRTTIHIRFSVRGSPSKYRSAAIVNPGRSWPRPGC